MVEFCFVVTCLNTILLIKLFFDKNKNLVFFYIFWTSTMNKTLHNINMQRDSYKYLVL